MFRPNEPTDSITSTSPCNDNPYRLNPFHHGFACCICGVMSVLAALRKLVPETKGRTLEPMEALWLAHGKTN